MKNRKEELKSLLIKFDEGQTTFDEEKRIKDLLRELDAMEFDFYKHYFESIDFSLKKRTEKSSIDFSFINQADVNQKKSTFTSRKLLKVAAIAILLIGAMFFGKHQQNKLNQSKAELALQQTVEALNLVGTKMNTAKEKMNYIEIFNDRTKPYINLNQK